MKKKICMLALSMICVLTPMSVFANQEYADRYASEQLEWEGNGLAETNGGLPEGDYEITVTHPQNDTEVTIHVDKETYEEFEKKGEQLVVQDKVGDAVSGIGVNANTTGAQELLSGVHPLVELFCGVLVYLIVLGLPIITCVDSLYITVPFLRNTAQSSAEKGGAMQKTRKDGSTGVRFVSDEAQYAVENANLGEGKSAISLYAKKRLWAFVLTSVMLYVLLTDNIQIFTDLAIYVVSGLLSAIQSITN